MTKKELIQKTLCRKQTGYIPVIPSATGFALSKSKDPAQCRRDPEQWAEIMVETRRRFGYDGLWAGIFQGVTAALGGGLTDKHGKVSVTGESTIGTYADMKKMKCCVPEHLPSLARLTKIIECLKKAEPDQPVIVIADNPSMSAAALMDGANYYKSMMLEPNFVHDLTELLMEPIGESVRLLIAAGADLVWLPEPTIGGTCISRTHYQEFCVPYNTRFNRMIKEQGAGLIVHTCGNWNDRFDIASGEEADCLHVAEADLACLKKEYGGKISIMGQLPAVFTMMMKRPEEVYAEALESCLTAAAGGGFILSPDCGMPAATPDENVRAMVQAARDAEKRLEC